MKKRGKENKEQKDFVWYSLRIGFAVMILLFISSFFVNVWALNLLFLILLLFNIVISIIHLFKYKRKAFAIIVLIISVLLAALYVIGLLVPAT